MNKALYIDVNEIEFIKPCKRVNKVNWKISDHTNFLIKCYAKYSGTSEDEVVDKFLKNLLKNQDFADWIRHQRSNKRMLDKLFPNQE